MKKKSALTYADAILFLQEKVAELRQRVEKDAPGNEGQIENRIQEFRAAIRYLKERGS